MPKGTQKFSKPLFHENILSSLTSIIHGLKGESQNSQSVFQIGPHIQFMAELVKMISIDEERTDAITMNSCGLIGDLITTLVTQYEGSQPPENYALGLFQFLNDDRIKNMLQEARLSRNNKIKQYGTWALRELRKLRTAIENSQNNNNNNNTTNTMYR